jgi:hypothetical protein
VFVVFLNAAFVFVCYVLLLAPRSAVITCTAARSMITPLARMHSKQALLVGCWLSLNPIGPASCYLLLSLQPAQVPALTGLHPSSLNGFVAEQTAVSWQ